MMISGLCDDSNMRPRKSSGKPMMPGDYERVEHELQRQLQHGRLEYPTPSMRNPWRDDDDLTTQPLGLPAYQFASEMDHRLLFSLLNS